MHRLLSPVKRHCGKITIASFIAIVTVWALNQWVVRSVDSRVFREISSLPKNDVGLVLGTGKYTKGGFINRHFRARTEAAAHLYHEGKVRHLLVSGDNHVKNYDEPTDMKNALLAFGVPESAITRDYAGFRTLDSVVRAKKVFGRTRLTIVTDDFHAHRAIFLCERTGIEAMAFCSERVPSRLSTKSRARECAARVKAVMDLYVLRTKPKFLGPTIEICVDDQTSGEFTKQASTRPSAGGSASIGWDRRASCA